MKTYVFDTVASMKSYNYKKYWIDPEIVRELAFNSDTLSAALEMYAENHKL